MPNTMQKTKTKTAIAVALVTFAIASSIVAAGIVIKNDGGGNLKKLLTSGGSGSVSSTSNKSGGSNSTNNSNDNSDTTAPLSAGEDKSGCNKILDKNCNGIYDNLGPNGQNCAEVERTGTDFSPSTCFYSVSAPVSNSNTSGVPTSSNNITYKPLFKCAGALGSAVQPYLPISNGYHYYRFTIPAGTYNWVSVASVLGVTGYWKQILVIKKDGNLTLDEFRGIVQREETERANGGKYIIGNRGVDNLYGSAFVNSVGNTYSLTNSQDGVITTVDESTILSHNKFKVTYSRDVTFTAILYIDNNGKDTMATNATCFDFYPHTPPRV